MDQRIQSVRQICKEPTRTTQLKISPKKNINLMLQHVSKLLSHECYCPNQHKPLIFVSNFENMEGIKVPMQRLCFDLDYQIGANEISSRQIVATDHTHVSGTSIIYLAMPIMEIASAHIARTMQAFTSTRFAIEHKQPAEVAHM